jgi:hypothetical protein
MDKGISHQLPKIAMHNICWHKLERALDLESELPQSGGIEQQD